MCRQTVFQIATPTVIFLRFSRNLIQMISVSMRKNRGTNFRNFDFKIFGEVLKKIVNFDLVCGITAAELCRPRGPLVRYTYYVRPMLELCGHVRKKIMTVSKRCSGSLPRDYVA